MPKRPLNVVKKEDEKRAKERKSKVKPKVMPKKRNQPVRCAPKKRAPPVKRQVPKRKAVPASRKPVRAPPKPRPKTQWDSECNLDVGTQVHGSEIDFHVDKLMRRHTGRYDMMMRVEIRHKRKNYNNLFVGARLKRHNSSFFRRPIPYGHGQLARVENENRKKCKGTFDGNFVAGNSNAFAPEPQDATEVDVGKAAERNFPKSHRKSTRTDYGRTNNVDIFFPNNSNENPYTTNGDRYDSSDDDKTLYSDYFDMEPPLKRSRLDPFYYVN